MLMRGLNNLLDDHNQSYAMWLVPLVFLQTSVPIKVSYHALTSISPRMEERKQSALRQDRLIGLCITRPATKFYQLGCPRLSGKQPLNLNPSLSGT